jgi:hypothetical protein
MKNLHLLPTDKPSRLRIGNNGNFILGLVQDSIKSKNDSYTNQNIYITNEEEIKVYEWVYCNKEGFEPVLKQKVNPMEVNNNPLMKKIILTTDADLIADGVQAIDDEFLEWFVKNSSCEEVKIIKVCSTGRKCDGKGKNCNVAELKIIIPKEEPKLTNNCPKCGLDLIEREGSKPYCTDIDCRGIILSNETLKEFAARKQESVETAARKLLYEKYPYHHPKYGGYFMDMFIEGAKWAEERTNK